VTEGLVELNTDSLVELGFDYTLSYEYNCAFYTDSCAFPVFLKRCDSETGSFLFACFEQSNDDIVDLLFLGEGDI
jgi:hypothetical protein